MTNNTQKITEEYVKNALPVRHADDHKGRFGTLGVLAGSARYRGAAVLCAAGALRCGAGIVRVAGTEAVCAAVAAHLPGCTLLPLPAGPGGSVAPEGVAGLAALPHSAIVAGCGLGNSAAAALVVERLLERANAPLLLDADALNVLAGHLEEGPGPATAERLRQLLKARTAAGLPVVLTPHVGEAARLLGWESAGVSARQGEAARALATELGCVVALKSHITVVAAPNGALLVNDGAGNPGLAKGGSGDVLAGVIGGLLAQGLAPLRAAAAGVWLHAAAADRLARRWGMAGLSPADLPKALARVLKALEGTDTAQAKHNNPPETAHNLRRLPLEGTTNTRDLGGYPCAGGGVTRWRAFVRSDNPSALTAADVDALRRYGIDTVVDLRRPDECARQPSALEGAKGFTVRHIPLDYGDGFDFEGDVPGSMAGLYIGFLDESKREMAQIMEVMAAAEGGVLFHCAVGKDRTGVVAMLLLKLAGVADADVVADYAVTDIYQTEIIDAQTDVFRQEIPAFVLRSRPASAWRALRHLAGRYGTAAGYLADCGAPPEVAGTLARRLGSS